MTYIFHGHASWATVQGYDMFIPPLPGCGNVCPNSRIALMQSVLGNGGPAWLVRIMYNKLLFTRTGFIILTTTFMFPCMFSTATPLPDAVVAQNHHFNYNLFQGWKAPDITYSRRQEASLACFTCFSLNHRALQLLENVPDHHCDFSP